MAKQPRNPLIDLRGYRQSLEENQTVFWGRFGVTQSAGSRYETGREIPIPLAVLVLANSEGLLTTEQIKKLLKKIE